MLNILNFKKEIIGFLKILGGVFLYLTGRSHGKDKERLRTSKNNSKIEKRILNAKEIKSSKELEKTLSKGKF